MSLPVCKFFLDGCCKFGSRCKFRHPYNSYGNEYRNEYEDDQHNLKSRHSNDYSGVSILRAGSTSSPVNYSNSNNQRYNNNGSSNNSNINSSHNANVYDLWKVIQKEVTALESCNQWPLTCFCLSREYGNMPGWIDHSPEELRWETYKAIKDGTFEQCKDSIRMLYTNAEERRNDFKTREKALPVAESLLQFKDSGQSTMMNNSISGPTSLFGSGPVQGGNVWVNPALLQPQQQQQQQQQQQPAFFGANSTAQQPSQANLFGNRQFHDPSTSFTFSLNAQQQPPMQQQNQAINHFNNSGFVNPVVNPVSPFQTTAAHAAPFQGLNIPSLAASVPFPQVGAFPISSPFGGATSVNHTDLKNYSNMDDLSESDIAAFQAKTFKCGGIPLKPPPKEMC